MTPAVMAALTGLLVVVPAAAIVVRRKLIRDALLTEARLRRSALEWRAGAARTDFERGGEHWAPDVGAAMAARLEELEGRRAELTARPLDDPGLAGDATGLRADYERFEDLTRALRRCQGTAAQPRSDVADLLAAGTGPAPAARSGSKRPAPAAISRLGDRLQALDERHAKLVRQVRDMPPADWPELVKRVQSLADEYGRLGADAGRAWERMFPDRAAARAAEGGEMLQRLLNDYTGRSERRPPRAGGSSGEDTTGGEWSWVTGE